MRRAALESSNRFAESSDWRLKGDSSPERFRVLESKPPLYDDRAFNWFTTSGRLSSSQPEGPETVHGSRTSSKNCSTPFETAGSRPSQAAEQIQVQPYQDAGEFAKVDLHRRLRCGFPEVIFGQGKTAAQIEAILKTLLEHEQGGLVTRLDPQAAAHLMAVFPQGEHNALGRTFRVPGARR